MRTKILPAQSAEAVEYTDRMYAERSWPQL